MTVQTIFFGSTSDSILVLEKLYQLPVTSYQLRVISVVTQPPRPTGRKQIVTPTPVELWAKEKNVPILSFPNIPEKPWLFADDQQVIDALQPLKADLLISACYGQKIPIKTIRAAKFGGLNIHPSLLPKWRGADPVPWAILAGDKQTGVTIVTLEDKFDTGKIIAQKKCSIKENYFADPLRTKLFEIGAPLLVQSLPDYLSGKNKGKGQATKLPSSQAALPVKGVTFNGSYARRLTRDDGFVPWEILKEGLDPTSPPVAGRGINGLGGSEGKEREIKKENLPLVFQKLPVTQLPITSYELPATLYGMFRALSPWPGIWTKINPTNPTNTTNPTNELKRLKILSCNLHPTTHNLQLLSVQLEGKNPVPFTQFQKTYL